MRKPDTDSFGNELPEGIFLSSDATDEEFYKAMAVNTFLLAAQVAMSKGRTVSYDMNSKTASIMDERGMSTFISH